MIWDGHPALLRTGSGLRQVLRLNRDRGWERATERALDAITGMGEDMHSSGEWTTDVSATEARSFAREHGWELFGDNGEPCRVGDGEPSRDNTRVSVFRRLFRRSRIA